MSANTFKVLPEFNSTFRPFPDSVPPSSFPTVTVYFSLIDTLLSYAWLVISETIPFAKVIDWSSPNFEVKFTVELLFLNKISLLAVSVLLFTVTLSLTLTIVG